MGRTCEDVILDSLWADIQAERQCEDLAKKQRRLAAQDDYLWSWARSLATGPNDIGDVLKMLLARRRMAISRKKKSSRR
jgi:hypothetical protein